MNSFPLLELRTASYNAFQQIYKYRRTCMLGYQGYIEHFDLLNWAIYSTFPMALDQSTRTGIEAGGAEGTDNIQ